MIDYTLNSLVILMITFVSEWHQNAQNYFEISLHNHMVTYLDMLLMISNVVFRYRPSQHLFGYSKQEVQLASKYFLTFFREFKKGVQTFFCSNVLCCCILRTQLNRQVTLLTPLPSYIPFNKSSNHVQDVLSEINPLPRVQLAIFKFKPLAM